MTIPMLAKRTKEPEVTVLMTKEEAKEIIVAVKASVAEARTLLLDLWERDGWRALGYKNWKACYTAEFGKSESTIYRQLTAAQVDREKKNGLLATKNDSRARESKEEPEQESRDDPEPVSQRTAAKIKAKPKPPKSGKELKSPEMRREARAIFGKLIRMLDKMGITGMDGHLEAIRGAIDA